MEPEPHSNTPIAPGAIMSADRDVIKKCANAHGRYFRDDSSYPVRGGYVAPNRVRITCDATGTTSLWDTSSDKRIIRLQPRPAYKHRKITP